MSTQRSLNRSGLRRWRKRGVGPRCQQSVPKGGRGDGEGRSGGAPHSSKVKEVETKKCTDLAKGSQ